MHADLWNTLISPLIRLLTGLAVGLLIANLLETLGLTRSLARLASPLARSAHMGDVACASFTQAFFSPQSANALLSEKFHAGELGLRELTLANLFNSFPAYLVHTPTLFFMIFPVLGLQAVVYVGLCLLAAFLRTACTVCIARILIPVRPCTASATSGRPRPSLRDALRISLVRLRKRLPRLFCITIPIYLCFYWIQVLGGFRTLEQWLGSLPFWSDIFSPQAAGIVLLHCMAELGSAIGASQAFLATGILRPEEVVLALLIGNILSTPIRALRHQLPSYAGYYPARLGLRLVLLNQSLRALSMICITVLYALCAF